MVLNEYITNSGDTFDIIAKELLGSEKLAPEIIKKNPGYCDVIIFSAGTKLVIPNEENNTTETRTNAPVWRD